MDLRLETRLKMSQEQRLTQAQRLEQRLHAAIELKQALAANIIELSTEVGIESDEVRERVYESVCEAFIAEAERLESEPPEEAETTDAGTPPPSQAFRKILLEAPYKAVFVDILKKHPTDLLCSRFSGAVFSTLLERGFFHYDKEKTNQGLIRQALENPQKVKAEMNRMRQNIEEAKRAKDQPAAEKWIRPYYENQYALQIAEEFQKAMGHVFPPLVKNLMEFEIDGVKVLEEYLLDTTLERLVVSEQVSDRITKNLSSKISRETTTSRRRTLRKSETLPQRIKDMMTNQISQMILVALGAIAPDLFSLQKGDQLDPDLEERFLKNTGKSLKEVLERHNLNAESGFRFYRYHTLGRTPSRDADNQIREFITSTVREDQEELLAAMNFETKFFDLLDRLESPEDREVEIHTFLQYLFEQEFYDVMRDLVRDKYVPELHERGLL